MELNGKKINNLNNPGNLCEQSCQNGPSQKRQITKGTMSKPMILVKTYST